MGVAAEGLERITGCPTARYRGQLLASALRYRDAATGLLVDESDAAAEARAALMRLQTHYLNRPVTSGVRSVRSWRKVAS